MVQAMATCGNQAATNSTSPANGNPPAESSDQDGEPATEFELLWWISSTFIQDDGNPPDTYEQKLADEFNASHPGITVRVEIIDFTTAAVVRNWKELREVVSAHAGRSVGRVRADLHLHQHQE